VEIVDRTPSEFLAVIEDPDIRAAMIELDDLIQSCLPGRERLLWEGAFWGGTEQSIVGYGHIVQPRPRGEDVRWFLVGLARQKDHFSVYLNAVDDGQYLGQHYAGELGKVKVGAASIGFKKLTDLDLDAFRAMLAQAHEITPPDPVS
jgi:hypothetical protein